MANPATFDAKFKEAVPLYEKLKGEWNRKPPNASKIDEILNSLKVHFLFIPRSIAELLFFLRFIQNIFAEGGFYPSDSVEDKRGLHVARKLIEMLMRKYECLFR